MGLVELPRKGRAFTWSNMQQEPLLEQLDWFFTSNNWMLAYPNTLVMPLAKITFWEDLWSEEIMATKFLVLFSFARNNSSVQELLNADDLDSILHLPMLIVGCHLGYVMPLHRFNAA